MSEHTLDELLTVPRVIAYFGHMVDAPERRTPRFPPQQVGPVRLAIRERLACYGAVHGFGCAAGGADLLFLEELIENGRNGFVCDALDVPTLITHLRAVTPASARTMGERARVTVEPMSLERMSLALLDLYNSLLRT